MRNKLNKFWIKTLPGIAWFFIVLILMMLPGQEFPTEDWMTKMHFDKLVHAGVFGTMAFLFIWPFLEHGIPRIKIKSISKTIIIATSVIGMLTELIQLYFIQNRSFDLLDWLADTVGAVCAWFIVSFLHKRMIMKTTNG